MCLWINFGFEFGNQVFILSSWIRIGNQIILSNILDFNSNLLLDNFFGLGRFLCIWVKLISLEANEINIGVVVFVFSEKPLVGLRLLQVKIINRNRGMQLLLLFTTDQVIYDQFIFLSLFEEKFMVFVAVFLVIALIQFLYELLDLVYVVLHYFYFINSKLTILTLALLRRLLWNHSRHPLRYVRLHDFLPFMLGPVCPYKHYGIIKNEIFRHDYFHCE